jgi:hypothetical protein
MKVYAVMCSSWNGEYDTVDIYALYAKEDTAKELVKTLMSGIRSSYSPNYWVDEEEVIGA